MNPAFEPRRAMRVPIGAEIALRRSFAQRGSAALLNLSVHGVQVAADERLTEGERLFVSLPGIETLEGKARWSAGFVAGVEFARPLHPAVFEMVSDRMKRALR